MSSNGAQTTPALEVEGLTKVFGSGAAEVKALDNISFSAATGEIVLVMGPSGSGKTTLLRIIAGLDWPDAGEVSFDGENALSRGAGERHVGFVFQHYALFRHMTVFENVAFGLRVQPRAVRKDEAAIRARVKELLDLVQLDWLADRYPSQLSGGQRQRIALARALAIEPRILLLDEPFGALDAKVRKELRQWLRTLHSEIHVTSIFVTHDQEEALEVANRVVVMDKGRIEQVGTPGDVYDNPATAFVHGFIGESIVLPVEVRDGSVRLDGKTLNIAANGYAPGAAKLYLPGFALMRADSSLTVLAGTSGCTVRTLGDTAILLIGAKSLIGSYGTLANRLGFTTKPVETTISV